MVLVGGGTIAVTAIVIGGWEFGMSSAPIVERLCQEAPLSMGALTDEGALALLSGRPLTHLRRLDLQHHYLGEEMTRRVREALPEVEVDLSRPMEPDDDEEGEQPWSYVAVSA